MPSSQELLMAMPHSLLMQVPMVSSFVSLYTCTTMLLTADASGLSIRKLH